MSSHTNDDELEPSRAGEMPHNARIREGVSWILPLAWDSRVSERCARHPHRFWKKMSQLEQFGLSEGGGPLLHKIPYEMIP